MQCFTIKHQAVVCACVSEPLFVLWVHVCCKMSMWHHLKAACPGHLDEFVSFVVNAHG